MTKLIDYSELSIRGNVPPAEAMRRLDDEVNQILEKRRWILERRAPRGEHGAVRAVTIERQVARAAWLFVAPALFLIGFFFFLPAAAALLLSLTDFDIYALADLGNARVVGLQQLRPPARSPALLDVAQEHLLLRARLRATHGARRARRGAARQRAARAIPHVLPHGVLHPVRHDARRRRDRVALPLPPDVRAAQLHPRRLRHRAGELARRSAVGDAGHHPDGGVEELRLLHADLHRGAPGDSPRALRGGASWTARARGGASST